MKLRRVIGEYKRITEYRSSIVLTYAMALNDTV